MTTQFTILIKKAYAAFNERNIDKAHSKLCNQMCSGQKLGRVDISADTMKLNIIEQDNGMK